MNCLPRDNIGIANVTGMKAHRCSAKAALHNLLKAYESSAANEKNLLGIDLDVLLVWVFAAALRRHIADGSFKNFQERLLHTLTGDVACNADILCLASDFVDLVNINDAHFGALDVVVGILEEPQNNVFNILANVAGCRATGMAHPDDVFLSFLPLSHMFERTGGYYLPLAIGAKVAFARGIQQLPDDLLSQRPTAMFAVPRVFERFAARIRDVVAGSSWKRGLLERCVVAGARVELGGATFFDRLAVPQGTGSRFLPRDLPAADAAEFVRAGLDNQPRFYRVEVLIDAPAATAPRFCTVSVTWNFPPRALVAGGFETALSTRSGRPTVTMAPGVAMQLFDSLVSVTVLPLSAHANRK